VETSPRHLFDITFPLSERTVVYPGDSPPSIRRVSDLRDGDRLTASTFSMGCHVGTHVDAPAHFLADGATLDEMPLESFYGPALVLFLPKTRLITKRDVEESEIPVQHHILFKTDNVALLENNGFDRELCSLTTDAAEYLCTFTPLSIGWDSYSLDNVIPADTFPAHVIFARANIPVFVCLYLKNVQGGYYWFSGLPLRLEGVEGAPVRAILSREIK